MTFIIDRDGKDFSKALQDSMELPSSPELVSKKVFDVWEADTTPKDEVFVDPSNGFEVVLEKRMSKRSRSALRTEAERLGIKRGVVPSHPGTSYNASEEDRQKAVEEALGIIEGRQRFEDQWKQRKSEAVLKYQNATGNADEDLKVVEEPSEFPPFVPKSTNAENRKTRSQRNRQMRHKLREDLVHSEKAEKVKLKDINKIPAILCEVRKVEPVSTKKPEIKPYDATLRLGPLKYERPIPEVLFSDEVKEKSPLRSLKVKNTLLQDHMNNLERQGVVETRKKRRIAPRAVKLYNIWD